ncbi:hypothetical protein DVH24_002160 [Malus domestica]|uniref:Aminoacyl-tRNA synthetase class II (D/K/N) domain-containing protein n=1 Tax=Malus domestica TaxID=3750 RepID=A0A498I8U5_MALDO|nr:hypothetical protein DVH24_002160 [Malus domestica]
MISLLATFFFVICSPACQCIHRVEDPVVQRQRFADQLKDQQPGDDEAIALDESFCRTLEYGLPPNGGSGLGVDRCVCGQLILKISSPTFEVNE